MSLSVKTRKLKRFALIFDVFLIFFIISILGVAYAFFSTTIIRQTRVEHQRLIESLNDVIDNFIKREIDQVELSLGYLELYGKDYREDSENIFASSSLYSLYSVASDMTIDNIYYFHDSTKISSLLGVDLSQSEKSEAIQKVLATGEDSVIPFHVSTISGRTTLAFLFPLGDGVLIAEPDINGLFSLISNLGLLKLYNNSVILLLKPQSGEVIYRSSSLIFPYFEFLSEADTAEIGGENYYFFKRALTDIQVDLVILTPSEYYLGSISRWRNYFFVIVAIVLLFYLVRRLWEQKAFFRPLELFFSTVNTGLLTEISLESKYYEWRSIEENYNGALRKIQEYSSNLAKTNKNLAITLNSIADAVIVTDPDGRIIRMNPVAVFMTGTAGIYRDKPIDDVLKLCDPYTMIPMENPVFQVFRNAGKKIRTENFILKGQVDKEFHISLSCAPVQDVDGQIRGAVLVFSDVTNRILREKELNRLKNLLVGIIDSMPSVIIGIDGNGNVTQWNKEAEILTGLTTEQAVGLSVFQAMPDLKGHSDAVMKSIKNRSIVRKEKVYTMKNNEKYFSDLTIYPLISIEEEGAVIRIDDITERVNIEVMMIQTEKMMSLGGLAAGMAHEINNPLAGITQNLQVLNRRLFEFKEKDREIAGELKLDLNLLREYLERRSVPELINVISRSGFRAADIVKSMLNFSRLNDQSPDPVDIHILIDEAVNLASYDYQIDNKFDFKLIEIIREYDLSLEKISCYSSELLQVFLNLLKNAAQSMTKLPKGLIESKIIIRTFRSGNHLIIEVEDNGPGINEQIQKRIFEPFFTTKEVGRGTGLGLSVSYFIITEKHKGRLEVISEEGKGAKFIISLPF
ncbi:MAG: ATP-binding protein [Spirochaetaceae bacterium]|jgi:PAS domain S-box-containing protein|nr:ATP-binding protein [Spirochaetaceae bacterium]